MQTPDIDIESGSRTRTLFNYFARGVSPALEGGVVQVSCKLRRLWRIWA
jgi:hypothetical protein